MQVSPDAQVTPAQASTAATQAGWQEAAPPGQDGEAAQTGALQTPWKHILPPGQ